MLPKSVLVTTLPIVVTTLGDRDTGIQNDLDIVTII
jgi:hypothetical protein